MFLISIPFFKIKTETSRIKLLRLIIRIKNEWLKILCLKKVMKKYINRLLPGFAFLYPLPKEEYD